MGIRTSVDLTVQAGFDNSLENLAFDQSFQEVLDTMEHQKSIGGGLLAGGQTNKQVSFDDVLVGRMIYIEADRDIQVTFGGAPAVGAQVTATGAGYPTGFSGGQVFDIEVDKLGVDTPIQITFDVADQTLQQVINRINAAAALLGFAVGVAFSVGGQLQIKSNTTGSTSKVTVTDSTTATILGFTGGATNTGVNPTPNASPLTLKRMGDSNGSDIDGLKAFALLTIQTTAMFITNPDPDNSLTYKLLIVGDLSAVKDC